MPRKETPLFASYRLIGSWSNAGVMVELPPPPSTFGCNMQLTFSTSNGSFPQNYTYSGNFSVAGSSKLAIRYDMYNNPDRLQLYSSNGTGLFDSGYAGIHAKALFQRHSIINATTCTSPKDSHCALLIINVGKGLSGTHKGTTLLRLPPDTSLRRRAAQVAILALTRQCVIPNHGAGTDYVGCSGPLPINSAGDGCQGLIGPGDYRSTCPLANPVNVSRAATQVPESYSFTVTSPCPGSSWDIQFDCTEPSSSAGVAVYSALLMHE